MVPAGSSADARHQARFLELQQDLHEEPRRNVVPLGDAANANRLARSVLGGQFQHGNAFVLGLGGYFHRSAYDVAAQR